jgi:hypothetical protein
MGCARHGRWCECRCNTIAWTRTEALRKRPWCTTTTTHVITWRCSQGGMAAARSDGARQQHGQEVGTRGWCRQRQAMHCAGGGTWAMARGGVLGGGGQCGSYGSSGRREIGQRCGGPWGGGRLK